MAGFLSSILFCVVIIATAWSRQPLIRAPYGLAKTGSFIIVLKKGSSESKLKEVITKIKNLTDEAQIQRYTEFIEKTITVKIPRDTLRKVRDFPEVDHIEEEDMAYGSQSSGNENEKTDPNWFLDHLNVPVDRYEEATVDVYVLDTGIQFEHSEFENRAKYSGYDPVDEYQYTVLKTPDYKPQRGRDCNGHGTLVASLIGGKTYGVAKTVTLFSVRVLGCDRTAPWSIVLDGLNFVASEASNSRRPAVIIMSLSGSAHASVDSSIEMILKERNILVVTPAGNSVKHRDACDHSPARNPGVLTVGAIDQNNKITRDSNYGACVDIFAPGETITGAAHTCPTCTVDGASGTSLAAALVCGIAAVHLSRSPLIDPLTLRQKLIDISSVGLINFTSDSEATSPNRLATFDGKVILKAGSSSASLQSTNFPSMYPNSLECKWTIVANKGQYIELTFEFIKLEEDYDFLTIKSGSSITRLTGDYGEIMCGYVSNSSYLELYLHTDATTSSVGFKAAYIAVNESSSVEECVKPIVNDIVQLDVLGAGHQFGNRFSMSKDWKEFFGGRRCGMNVAVLHEDSGEIVLQENYDIDTDYKRGLELARRIENIRPGSIVAMTTCGQAIYLTLRTERAIATLGSSLIQDLYNNGGTWAMIGVKGFQPGKAIEKISSTSTVELSTQVKLQPYREVGVPIFVQSTGIRFNNHAKIMIDDAEIELHPDITNTSGLYVVTVHEKFGEVLDNRLFKTHFEALASSPFNDFADFINAVPKGRIVAIASNLVDTFANLSEDAKRACESIGSRLIRQVEVGGSWAIVGRKGASIGTVPESASNCADTQALYYLPVTKFSADELCSISVTTSSFVYGDNKCYKGSVSSYLSVGDQVHPFNKSTSRGITLAIVSTDSCTIDQVYTFDTHDSETASQELVSFLNAVIEGQLVVATIYDEGANNLERNAEIALESIGSAMIRNVKYRDAWAIIGRKGATLGSVPEIYDKNSASIGYHAYQTPFFRFGLPIMVQSAGTTHGNYAKILSRGQIANGGSSTTGLNVILLDEKSGQILESRNFKTQTDTSDSENLANFITSLPDGCIVAMAIKGDAIAHLSEDAKHACESIGSRHIRQVEVGGSWAIVGRKGASIGTVPESASNCANAQALYYLPIDTNTNDSCRISVTTSGFVSGARDYECGLGGVSSYLSVGSQVHPSSGPLTRGITLAIVNEDACSIDKVQTFDTYGSLNASESLVTFLSAVTEGQIVIGTVFDEASHQLSEYAKIALEGIGSSLIRNVRHRDAWAIIGRKGAAKRSVLETHDLYTASIGYRAPRRFSSETTDRGNSCDRALYLNC